MNYRDGGDGRVSRPRPLVSPNNMMPVEVIGREIAAPGVVTLFLAIPGTQQPPAPYLPGQFVTLALPTALETLYRSYSLCGDGLPDRPWEITIKRMREGAVSTYLFDEVSDGTLLYASFPRGAFTLPADVGPATPLVFVAVGSGVTPIIGMLRALALMPPEERPSVQLHYASRTAADIIYRDELAAMDEQGNWLQQFHYLSSANQRLKAADVVRHVGKAGRRAHWYMCGPESLKHELQGLLRERGVPPERILAEVFATQRGASRIDFQIMDTNNSTDVAYMRVQATDAVLGVKANETVLVALERHGYQPDFSCRTGSCGVCKQHLVSGKVTAPGALALTNRERAQGDILTCVAVPDGDIVLESGGRPPVAGGGVGTAVGGRALTTALLRVGMFATAGGLLLGAWQLTNHRPFSWDVGATANVPTPTATTGVGGGNGKGGLGSGKGTPTATPTKPSPTRVPGAPVPTLAPGQPTATPAPTATTAPPPPQPTATTAPSKAH